MARPQHLASYGEPDAAALAAAYAYGIARNHPFIDGNKRTAAVVSETFLSLNGVNLNATKSSWRSSPSPRANSARRSWPTGFVAA